jgi:hypothetical protein
MCTAAARSSRLSPAPGGRFRSHKNAKGQRRSGGGRGLGAAASCDRNATRGSSKKGQRSSRPAAPTLQEREAHGRGLRNSQGTHPGRPARLRRGRHGRGSVRRSAPSRAAAPLPTPKARPAARPSHFEEKTKHVAKRERERILRVLNIRDKENKARASDFMGACVCACERERDKHTRVRRQHVSPRGGARTQLAARPRRI